MKDGVQWTNLEKTFEFHMDIFSEVVITLNFLSISQEYWRLLLCLDEFKWLYLKVGISAVLELCMKH